MKDQNNLQVGSIVIYKGGYYRVSRSTRETVNLRGVWGSRRALHKAVSKSEVAEAEEAFMENWRNSESYMCM